MKVKLVVMKEVAQHGSGYSFGELSLVNNKPRAATVYVRSNKCIMAVLNKRDYLRVLGDNFKQMVDEKIARIQQFEFFKPFTKFKLRALVYYFQERTGDSAYKRNQYIYRQGDPVDGVYCILQGEVKRLKEDWVMTRDASGNLTDRTGGSSYINLSNYSHDIN